MRSIGTLFLVLFGLFAQAQSSLSIGDWETLLPLRAGKHVTQSSESVYYATEVALMRIDKETFEMTPITKVQGLHDVGIATLAYDDTTDRLLLAYDNTKLDIISGGNVVLVNDIFEKPILGDKTIYDVYMSTDSKAYLSTGFGIIQFDMQTLQFGYFTEIPYRVNVFAEHNGKWYVGTEDGTYTFDPNVDNNPAFFDNWHLLGAEVGLPALHETIDLDVSNDGTMYLMTTDELYRFDGAIFEAVADAGDMECVFTTVKVDGSVVCGLQSNDNFFDFSRLYGNDFFRIDENCSDITTDAVADQYGRLWLADEYNDFRSIDASNNCQRITSNGPNSKDMSDLLFVDDTLYIASGGASDNFNYSYSSQGTYRYADGNWENYHQYNTYIFADSNLINQFVLAKQPRQRDLIIGTYWNGIVKFDAETRQGIVENQYTDCSLGPALGDEQRTRIAGLLYDDDGNLWISNFGAEKPLSVLTSEGVWHSYGFGSATNLSDIAIDPQGRKWIILGGSNGGVLVFDDNGTLADPTDDQHYVINRSNSVIESNRVFSVAVDLEGDVWVGTETGPIIFRCGQDVFDGECTGNIRKVYEDSILAPLLKTELIRTMHIDGGNRKWFGTSNGVYVQSADANEKVHHYTVDNSPLLDNTIIDFAFDGKDGLMYIATNNGLNLVRTEATSAPTQHRDKVYAYPNPVELKYTGPIAIKGLARNANVKITDVNGLLVYETTAIGGQAIWDGRDYDGRMASSGTYLVFSSTTDTFLKPNTYVTKILIVR